jgi:hypothetical protein
MGRAREWNASQIIRLLAGLCRGLIIISSEDRLESVRAELGVALSHRDLHCSLIRCPQHEFRGKSWSMGGDPNATTLPNFIMNYSPELSGYSLGKREVRLCWGFVCRDVHVPGHDKMK